MLASAAACWESCIAAVWLDSIREKSRPAFGCRFAYQYDYAGRKFLFSFDQHQVIEVSHYRRIGTPKEALPVVQSELSSGKTFREDP